MSDEVAAIQRRVKRVTSIGAFALALIPILFTHRGFGDSHIPALIVAFLFLHLFQQHLYYYLSKIWNAIIHIEGDTIWESVLIKTISIWIVLFPAVWYFGDIDKMPFIVWLIYSVAISSGLGLYWFRSNQQIKAIKAYTKSRAIGDWKPWR